MHATFERFFPAPVFFVTGLVLCGAASAQTLPPFHRFPADAPLRLAQAVEDQMQVYAGAFAGATAADPLRDGSRSLLEQPDLRRSLWDAIEGAMAAPKPGQRPTPLLDVLDSAIGAYMKELGSIAYEIDRSGAGDTVATLAPLHPGEQGSGTIAVGTLGPFHQLAVSFRGEIEHPDGRSPAVVAQFYMLSGQSTTPVPGRLLIPTTGAQPSFRAEIANRLGESEVRDYGWRPRLARTSSILELMIDGRWTRVVDDVDVTPQHRPKREPIGFCDATCTSP